MTHGTGTPRGYVPAPVSRKKHPGIAATQKCISCVESGKDGKLKVRATERFVEGARKAKRQDWQTVNLIDFLGI